MNTYGLLGDTRRLPTQIPTQNNRYAKLACARSCCDSGVNASDGLETNSSLLTRRGNTAVTHSTLLVNHLTDHLTPTPLHRSVSLPTGSLPEHGELAPPA